MSKKRHNPEKPQNNYGGDYDCINYDTTYDGKTGGYNRGAERKKEILNEEKNK
jgi:hypothetical protein